MPTSRLRAALAASGLIALCWLSAANVAPSALAAQQPAPTVSAPRVQTPTPGSVVPIQPAPTFASGTQPPISTIAPSPSVPTATPRPTVVHSGPPLTGLVLVPSSSRVGGPTPGNAADLTAVRGRVLDANGQGLWGQVVKITGRNGVQAATTDDFGFYELDGLIPGSYSVVVDNQICTPAANLNAPAGAGLEVDFAQIRTASTAIVAQVTQTPGTPAPTRTPRPAQAANTATATPRPSPTPISLGSWWGWFGFSLNVGELWSSLFVGVMGGALLVVLGLFIRIVRR